MANNLVTENYLRLNFTPKTGVTPGTDDHEVLSAAEIIARYAVTITPSTGAFCPKQSELTASLTAPSVGRDDDILLEDNRIYATGYLIDTGNAAITDKGFVISTNVNNLTLATCLFSYSYGAGGEAATEWAGWMTGLTAETQYYFKSYATNSEGTSYSAYNLGTTLEPATAPDMGNITFPDYAFAPTIVITSNVSSDGGKAITERGICFDTTSPPRIATGYKHLLANQTGDITATVTRPESSTPYYFSSYAINEIGISYQDYPILA